MKVKNEAYRGDRRGFAEYAEETRVKNCFTGDIYEQIWLFLLIWQYFNFQANSEIFPVYCCIALKNNILIFSYVSPGFQE